MKNLSEQIVPVGVSDILGKPEKPVECPKCKCTWFEQKQFVRVSANHYSSIHTSPMLYTVAPNPIYMLKCAKCGAIFAPPMDPTSSDKIHEEFLSIFEEKEDK